MIDRGKKNIAGVLVDAVDYAAVVERVIEAAEERAPLTVAALAVHGVMTGSLDLTHRHRLNHLDLAVPDGQPVRWALNLLHGARLADRVYGPQLMLEVCRAAAAREVGIYLYGSTETVLESLTASLQTKFDGLRVVGARASRFRALSPGEKDETVARIRDSGAGIVFVGLGCPRQEIWLYEYGPCLSMPLLAVGAAFDFHAGTLPQAPSWIQRGGLEWLFRLSREPRRLWRRYVLLNPAFIGTILLQALGIASRDPDNARAPSGEVSPG